MQKRKKEKIEVEIDLDTVQAEKRVDELKKQVNELTEQISNLINLTAIVSSAIKSMELYRDAIKSVDLLAENKPKVIINGKEYENVQCLHLEMEAESYIEYTDISSNGYPLKNRQGIDLLHDVIEVKMNMGGLNNGNKM